MSERLSRWHLVLDLGSEHFGPLVIARHEERPFALYAMASQLALAPEEVEGLRILTDKPLRLTLHRDGQVLDCALATVGGERFAFPPLRAPEVAATCGLTLEVPAVLRVVSGALRALEEQERLRVVP